VILGVSCARRTPGIPPPRRPASGDLHGRRDLNRPVFKNRQTNSNRHAALSLSAIIVSRRRSAIVAPIGMAASFGRIVY